MKPVALVTGGTRGIGLGIARQLAESGFDLCLCGVRGLEDVSGAVEDLKSCGAQVLYQSANIGSSSERKSLLQQVETHFHRLDVLVNNAGIAPRERKNILDATEESFDRVLEVNLKGPYFLTQAVARWMIRQRDQADPFNPSIINISSISSTVASPDRGEYCISKAGVSMATRLWAVRLAEFGIGVYEVRPGIIQTDMTAAVTEKYDRLIQEGLLLEPRWGTPQDVGRAVSMLARGELNYATGQVLVLDGGLTIDRL